MSQIIIVEDDPIQIKILRWTLSQHYDVRAFTSAEDLVAELDQIETDMFLLDLNLPHMDGFTLSQHIRGMERFAETPMIAVSAHTDTRTRQRCLDLSFTDFIKKPIFTEEFLETVQSYLQAEID